MFYTFFETDMTALENDILFIYIATQTAHAGFDDAERSSIELTTTLH